MNAATLKRAARRLLPIVSVAPWGGATDDLDGDVQGRSLTIEWLGLFVEICLGRVSR